MNTSSDELTGWYPVDVHPVREGVFELHLRDDDRSPLYAFWDGAHFRQATDTVEAAYEAHDTGPLWPELEEGLKWRGLASDVHLKDVGDT